MTAVSIESSDRESLYEEGVASSDGDEQISDEYETDEDEITTMAGSSAEHESDHGEQDYDRSETPRLDEVASAFRGTGPPPVELGNSNVGISNTVHPHGINSADQDGWEVGASSLLELESLDEEHVEEHLKAIRGLGSTQAIVSPSVTRAPLRHGRRIRMGMSRP